MKINKWITIAALATQVAITNVRADETSDAIESLKKQIEALSAKVNELEASRAAAAAAPAAQEAEAQEQKPRATPIIYAGANGFGFQSADTNFTLRLHGFGQFDWHYYASPAIGQKDTFTIRRMRLIAEGSVYQDYDYFVQSDFASGLTATTTNDSLLTDAYVNYHPLPEFQIQAGKFKPPVSLEELAADSGLWFVERGLPTELAPVRDVGIEVHGDLLDGTLNYAAGAFNGVADGGSGDIEVSDTTKDVVSRFMADPFKNTSIDGLRNLNFGLGGSYGDERGVTATYTTLGRQKIFAYNSGTGAKGSPLVTEAGPHLRLDPQAYYYWGPLALYGEYAITSEKFELAAGGKPAFDYLDNKGWNVGAAWNLTGEPNVIWTLPAPLHPFRLDGSGWGAWQVAARIGELTMDPKAFSHGYAPASSAQTVTAWSVALNWYLNRNARVIFDFEDAAFGGGSKAHGAVTAQNEKAFLGRLQFGF